MILEWNGYQVHKSLFQNFNHEQIAAMLGGHEMPPKYIGKTRIPEDHIRTYHELIDSNKFLSEIERYPPQDFDFNIIKNVFDHSKKSTFKIDEFSLYVYVENVLTFILLVDENNKNAIAAFAAFMHRPDLRTTMWQAKNSISYYPYKGKFLVAKIYKFCKEQLEWTIQSDLKQTKSAEILWSKTLPKIGINPKILDLETHRVHDNDGSLNVYGNERYCWIIESNDHYRNHINAHWGIPPFSNLYVTKKNYIK